MFLAIMQRFLDDSVHAGLQRVGKLLADLVLREVALDPAAPHEVFQLKLQGGDETEVVQQRRAQQPRNIADRLYGASGEFASALQPIANHFRLSAEQRLQLRDLDLQQRQRL